MLCTFCNSARLDNEAPCPRCGAPSPLLASSGIGTPGTVLPWGDISSSTGNLAKNNQLPHVMMQTSTQSEQQQQMSLLPVPYQPQQSAMMMPTASMQAENGLIPMQQMGSMAPALPGDGQDGAVYIPPMYTKPRAIIPRYRAISGLLSVLIVIGLLCAGVSYYVNASGKLTMLSQFYKLAPPPNVKPTAAPVLADPKANPDFGPAYSIINSATTNSRIDPISHASAQPTNIFQVNQTIYLTYSVQHPKTAGVMIIKWYTNGSFYQSSPPVPVTTNAITGYTTQKYTQPAEGKVELYWNDQLAIRLYFVVR